MIPFRKGFSRTDTSGTIHYRHAVSEDAEKLAKLYDDVYKGGYPIVDCLDPVKVRKLVERGEHIWMVALDGDNLVGAAVAKPESWNRSYETCRSVTHGAYNGRNIGSELYAAVLQAVFHRSDCDVVFGYPRSGRMKRLLERATPPITIVGSDGGMHIVSGEREEHLFCVTYNPHVDIKRVSPVQPMYEASEGLAKLVDGFGLSTVAGGYPAERIVGPAGDGHYESSNGKVSFSYFQPSRCAAIVSAEGDDVEGVRRAVWDFVAPQATPPKGVPSLPLGQVSMYVLADKTDLIARLCEPFNGVPAHRFGVSAYLPAWFEKETLRYDCVLLSARFDVETPKMYETEKLISFFQEEFKRLDLRVMTQSIYTR